ncbi:MAG: helix-turn-helix transcriptional regulator [Ruminococcaceae bacterium]|nr:helix-turn-helix transcriptional regulator [Oscillospiraceae bacterium]
MMNRIRDLREDRDLSQAEIASVIKTTQQQYSKIELGKADISGEKLKLLATFYNVSADYILGLPEGMPYGNSKTRRKS